MTASEVAQYLRQNDRYLIISHRNPDGDTLGCAGAICSALREIGKTAYVLNNEQITKRYEEYVSEFIAPEDYVPETILTADVASLEMLPDNAGRYADRIDLSVDHHAYNGLFARHNCVMGEKAACGEIVFNIILKMKGSVSVKCAELLFIAISTDTGCFKYNNTTSDTMRIAAELLDIGIRADKIRKEMFMTRTRNRLIFEGMVNRGMEFFCEGRVAVNVITLDMIKNSGIGEEDLEDISSFAVQVEGVEVGITIRERKDRTSKISVRTAGKADAGKICMKLGGGGHTQAAGCSLSCPPVEAKQKILAVVYDGWNQ